jgi:cytochrome c oxidase subunit 2
MGFLNKLFGIPPVGSEHGEMVDHMLELVHWVMLFLFVGWSIYLTYTLIRYYRKNNPKADHAGVRGHASSHIEIGVIIAEIILLLGFAFPLWATQVDRFPNPDVRVNAWAQQFGWWFHYPGPDGKFGATSRFAMTGDNPIGIDPEDPNSLDDFITNNSLVLPKGRKIEIAVTSKDVIHNLALVAMRAATDADPAKVNRIWFVPTLAGKSDIVCGQLCGDGHGIMKAELEIKDNVDAFNEWQKEQQPVRDKGFAAEAVKKLGAAAPAPAATPATPPATPAPPTPAAGEATVLELGVIPNVMQFDKKELTCKAGAKVTINFVNKADVLQHNFLLVKPGTKDKVGALADSLLTSDPAGAPAKLYIPDSPDILVKGTKLIGIGQTEVIEFTAPAEPGDYTYICTFPGHWRLMHGVLHVTK